MVFRRSLIVAGVLVATLGMANASTFDWSFSSSDFPWIAGSGTLDALGQGGGTFLVDTISGSVSDTCTGTPCVPVVNNVTGLLTPGQAYGGFTNIPGDNLVFPSGSPAFLSQGGNYGLVFSIDGCPFAAGCFMQIYFSGAGLYNLFASNGGVNGVDFLLSGAITATPLPPAFPLFAGGLGALGLLGWCRKRMAQAA